jgi:hypothetical protein
MHRMHSVRGQIPGLLTACMLQILLCPTLQWLFCAWAAVSAGAVGAGSTTADGWHHKLCTPEWHVAAALTTSGERLCVCTQLDDLLECCSADSTVALYLLESVSCAEVACLSDRLQDRWCWLHHTLPCASEHLPACLPAH